MLIHLLSNIHNNADALSRSPCKDDHCSYCDRYENRYSSETLAEINTSGAVKAIAFIKEKSESDKQITHYVIGGDHEITLPSNGGDQEITLSDVGSFKEHKESATSLSQKKNSEHEGSFSCTGDSGSVALTATSLGPGVAEVLSSEMSHGMTQIGVPHFTLAMLNSVCDGVDAETHKIICCHQVHCCCCKIAANSEDCWDLFEDKTLFGCLF